MTESSPDTAATPVADENAGANAASPTVENEGVEATPLSVLEAALGGTEATPATDKPGSKEPEPVAAAPETTPETDLTDAEKSKLSERAQHRFQHLANEARAAKEELEAVKPKLERIGQIEQAMAQNNATPEHLANALAITGMVNRREFDRAIPIFEQMLGEMRKMAGETLPPELRQRVDTGYLTEADAKALNKAQIAAQTSQEQLAAEKQARAVQEATRQRDEMVSKSTSYVDKWAQEQTTTDPDWNLKTDLIGRELQRRLMHDPAAFPRTENEVRKLMSEIKTDVEGLTQRFAPAPKPMQPVTGGAPSTRSAPTPSSPLDVVEMALARGN